MNALCIKRFALSSLTAFVLIALSGVVGCVDRSDDVASVEEQEWVRPAPNPDRNAYFGDLHVHTKHSFDAYLFEVRATPDDAYRYAKGEAIQHAGGFPIQLETGPLDFEAVTDHGIYMGAFAAMDDPKDPLYQEELAAELRGETGLDVGAKFQRAVKALLGQELANMPTDGPRRSAWQDVIAAAERHNDPGRFTTFVGYEYTAVTPKMGNLHRNVIFKGSAPDLPFAGSESLNPEDLWDWMDNQRDIGNESLAIPHNSNGSNGAMFQLRTVAKEPLSAEYADQRTRNEPLVEITQVKGTSDTHPLLSPQDDWADFEIYPYRIGTALPSEPRGSYVREALLNGLVLEDTEGFNPFDFGFIGSSDTHNAGGTPEESNYHSKAGMRDNTPVKRGSVPMDKPDEDGNVYSPSQSRYFSASGLAGVWAEENTRESLYAALRRKETFATSGPRMRVRFFAGSDFPDVLLSDSEVVAKAYRLGVPMGGDLLLDDEVSSGPRFLAWAMRDTQSAPLQRLQIIKGWVEGGKPHEQVFDIACSDGSVPDQDYRCADNGATVDTSDCSVSAGKGAAELKALWTDPSFDQDQLAVYYVRVLENPTCRWSTWDAVRAGTEPNPELPLTVQERAWSSPIWVRTVAE